MKKIGIFLSILLSSFGIIAISANAAPQYFGFVLTDVGWDDPSDGIIKTNYVDEVAPFTNTGDILPSGPTDNIVNRLQLMQTNGMKGVLHLNDMFFQRIGTGGTKSGVLMGLRPDYQTRWNTFVSTNNLTANSSLIESFYVGEEPAWNSISYSDLKAATDYVKSTVSSVPISIIESYNAINLLQVPTSVDWIGFDLYGIRNPNTMPEYRAAVNLIKSKRSTASQKLVIVMDTHFIQSSHGDVGGLTQSDMAAVATSYYDLALSEPDTIAIWGYFWPSGFHATTAVGARNLPQNVKDEHKRIGKLITGKDTPDIQAPTVPGTPTGSSVTFSSLNLNWTASTDNIGVTNYRVERCTGASCVTFAEIGTPTTNSYSDFSLSTSTVYLYRVRAVDAAGNLSGYSGVVTATTNSEPAPLPTRYFKTSFESVSDFQNFYIVPQYYKGTMHELSQDTVQSGIYAHKAVVYQANEPSTPTVNNNHRGYPTIQLYKTTGGAFQCPCDTTFWVWVDAALRERVGENEWLSFATFTSDESDSWLNTVLVNLSYDGFVHLMHVPVTGKSEWTFQTKDIKFPMKQWVKIRVYLDMSPQGEAKVWQNDELVSSAKVQGTNGKLGQAHFGLYAAPSVSQMTVYNDDLSICEVENELSNLNGLACPPGGSIPTAVISASPASITSGQSSTLTWSSTDATSCTASGGWTGLKAISGTQSVSPTVTTTYTMACSGTGGTSTAKSATVTVTAGGVGPAGYTFAVNEGGTVAITGTKDVAFGANGSFYYKYNQTANLMCDGSAFGGDPIVGVAKACYTKTSAVGATLVINTTRNSNFRLGYSNFFRYLNQSFKLPVSGTITGAEIMMQKIGAPTSPITVSIRSSLSGPDIATGTIQPSMVTTSSGFGWVTVPITGSPVLTGGTTYYLRISVPGTSTKNYYRWATNSANPYSSGTFYRETTAQAQYDATAKIAYTSGIAMVATPTLLARQLDQGSKGEDVSILQNFLASFDHVYPEKLVTGYYGSLTANAVSAFQGIHGIPSIGRVGPMTLEKLNKLLGG